MHHKIWLALILAVSLIIRFWHNLDIALWHDEAFSALLVRMPFTEMMQRIALDVHPPFYYWLLRGWAWILGDSILSLRAFSVVFGTLSVWMLYKFVRHLTQDSRLGLAAAALLSVNALHIRYSLEARMYTLGTFLVILSSYLMLRAIENNKWRWWLAYALATAASGLTHYFLFFSTAAQGLFLLIWWWKKQKPRMSFNGLRWLWSYLLSLALFAFWLPTFVKQFSQVQENYWIPKIRWWSVPDIFWKMLLRGFDNTEHIMMGVATVLFAGLTVAYLVKYRRLHDRLPVIMVIAPFILAILASIQSSIFLDRYFIFAAVFALAILAVVLGNIRPKVLASALLTILVLASGLAYAYGLNKLDPANRPGMKAATEYLFAQYPLNCRNQNTQKSKVVVGLTAIYFNYQYYYEQYLDPIRQASLACELNFLAEPKLHLPGVNSVSQIPHFSGAALLEDKNLLGNLENFAQAQETVWLLWTTGFYGQKPEVPTNWHQISQEKFGDVYEYRGEIFVTKYQVE